MRVGITYDLRQEYLEMGFGEEETVEFDRVDTVDAIERTLRSLGFEADRIGNVRRLVERLARGDRWDLVFNIAEGLYGFGREAQVPAVLDAFAIPYTFSDPMVCAIALHKGTCNHLVQNLGVPTAEFHVVHSLAEIDDVRIPFPLFAKPVAEGTSKGVTGGSKVRNRAELEAACSALLDRFRQPVLVETFLPGREFTVGIVGTGDSAAAVGAMEVVLSENAEQEVYSYHNKAHFENLVEYRLGDPSDPLVAKTIEIALQAWRGLRCRDAGRVDLRADADGNPRFIEVNPLAGMHPEISDLPILCKLAGVTYKDLLGRVMASAMERIPPKPAMIPAGLPQAPAAVNGNGTARKPARPIRTAGSSKNRRVVVLHEKVDPDAPADRQDLLREIEYLSGILRAQQYEVLTLPMSLDLRAVALSLRRLRPSIVFNMSETVDGQGRLVHFAPAILERVGIPFTGSGSDAMYLTSNKVLAKKLLAEAGIPTAPWVTLEQVAAGDVDFPPPYIIKSVWEEASIGLDEDSVIREQGSLLHEMERRLSDLGGTAFAEAFIDGREFNVAVLAGPSGPEVLPIAEMCFLGYPEGKVRVVGYRAKWEPTAFEYNHTVRRFEYPAEDEPLLARLKEVSVRCWDVFGTRGYIRVDFRVSPDGTPYVLEVNANPCLSPDGGFMAAAAQAGLSADHVMRRILADLSQARPKGELFLVPQRPSRPKREKTHRDVKPAWEARPRAERSPGLA
jgi:D-alanine-D-alanine ligase